MGASCCNPIPTKTPELVIEKQNTLDASYQLQCSPKFGAQPKSDQSTNIKPISSKEAIEVIEGLELNPNDQEDTTNQPMHVESNNERLVEVSGDNELIMDIIVSEVEMSVNKDKDFDSMQSSICSGASRKSNLKKELKYSHFKKMKSMKNKQEGEKKVRFYIE